MKFVIVFAALFSVCAALPPGPPGPPGPGGPDASAVIVRDLRTNDGVSGYNFEFETSNNIARQETGVAKNIGEETVIVVDGVASWVSPEGIQATLKFVADENGYQPVLPIV